MWSAAALASSHHVRWGCAACAGDQQDLVDGRPANQHGGCQWAQPVTVPKACAAASSRENDFFAAFADAGRANCLNVWQQLMQLLAWQGSGAVQSTVVVATPRHPGPIRMVSVPGSMRLPDLVFVGITISCSILLLAVLSL